MDFNLSTFFSIETVDKFIRIVFILVLGIGSIQIVSHLIKRSLRKQLSRQRMMIVAGRLFIPVM
ncbi:MAG: hypothetical protein Q8P34_01705 [Bacteroidota bacterium]|nr:hypothetical protein [Bacteroidota bacterium]